MVSLVRRRSSPRRAVLVSAAPRTLHRLQGTVALAFFLLGLFGLVGLVRLGGCGSTPLPAPGPEHPRRRGAPLPRRSGARLPLPRPFAAGLFLFGLLARLFFPRPCGEPLPFLGAALGFLPRRAGAPRPRGHGHRPSAWARASTSSEVRLRRTNAFLAAARARRYPAPASFRRRPALRPGFGGASGGGRLGPPSPGSAAQDGASSFQPRPALERPWEKALPDRTPVRYASTTVSSSARRGWSCPPELFESLILSSVLWSPPGASNLVFRSISTVAVARQGPGRAGPLPRSPEPRAVLHVSHLPGPMPKPNWSEPKTRINRRCAGVPKRRRRAAIILRAPSSAASAAMTRAVRASLRIAASTSGETGNDASGLAGHGQARQGIRLDQPFDAVGKARLDVSLRLEGTAEQPLLFRPQQRSPCRR